MAWGQKRDLRRGNREFRKEQYDKADISYRKGLLKDSTNVGARYNLANNLYRQGNFDEAAKQMDAIPVDSLEHGSFRSDCLFNRGDIAIAQEDWQTAVDCFIKYLIDNPDDYAAKENYTYARYHLQNQDQNQNGDGSDDKQDQNKDQNQQDQQNQDQQNDNGDQGQNGQQQLQPVELSPQQAQQLLQAIQDKERQTQEKVDEKKAAALKSRQKEKNW